MNIFKALIPLLLLAVAGLSTGQSVPSSCTAPDSILARYADDADRLTLHRIYDDTLTYIDSIIIPQEYSDSILGALIAVYNATDLPARDTIIDMYNIHTFLAPELHNLMVSADSNLPWMQNLRNNVIPCGNAKVDSLMNLYDFFIEDYSNNYGLFWYHTVTLKSGSSYNLYALANVFNTIPDVYYSHPFEWIGDGNDIAANIIPGYIELIYSVGWMDCLNGCVWRRYWKFNIYADCSVEFTGSYGNYLSMPELPEETVSPLKVYPNPFDDVLFVEELPAGAAYSLYNHLGQKVAGGWLRGNTITGLNKLLPGQYYLNLAFDKHFITYKIIKK